MKYVYYLEHAYEDKEEIEYVTDLGVYSTRKKANEALEKFKNEPKFKDHPADFNIDKYAIDEPEWKEGFFIWT